MGATISINKDTNWFCRKGYFDILAQRVSDARVTWLPKLFDDAIASNIYLVDLSDEETYLKKALDDVVVHLVSDLREDTEGKIVSPDYREYFIKYYLELHDMLQSDIKADKEKES